MQHKTYLFVALFIVFSTDIFAQRHRQSQAQDRREGTVNICGEYTFIAPGNISLENAKEIAVERARIDALAAQFGRTVTQQTATVIRSEIEAFDARFLSLGGSEVRGIWLEDTREPTIEPRFEQGTFVVRVSNVCGRARAITNVAIDVDARVLRNGTDAKHEDNNFRHGDDLFLSFRSPINGFLAVYLVDESLTAFRLLPYGNDTRGVGASIIGGQDHIFFSRRHIECRDEAAMVDEYQLYIEKPVEHAFVYIIFSPEEFIVTNAARPNEPSLPRTLPFEEFRRWLAGNREHHDRMTIREKVLTIIK